MAMHDLWKRKSEHSMAEEAVSREPFSAKIRENTGKSLKELAIPDAETLVSRHCAA
jgi:hypothetical protein